jgi:hypothetical protein
MDKVSAYIDESGDPRFNEGSSSRLEFSAIMIESIEESKNIENI